MSSIIVVVRSPDINGAAPVHGGVVCNGGRRQIYHTASAVYGAAFVTRRVVPEIAAVSLERTQYIDGAAFTVRFVSVYIYVYELYGRPVFNVNAAAVLIPASGYASDAGCVDNGERRSAPHLEYVLGIACGGAF